MHLLSSEDMTSVIKKIKYDSIANTFVGFPIPLVHGIPIKEYYKTDSFDIFKSWLSSIEQLPLLNVHMIQPLQSSSQNVIPNPFLFAAYGTSTTTTTDDILQRWWYIFNQFAQRKIRIIGFSTGKKRKYVFLVPILMINDSFLF